MKKTALTAAVILFVVTVMSVAYSHGGGRGHGKDPGYGEGMVAAVSKLDLSADQKTKINALREAQLKEIKPLQDRHFSKRGDLKLLWMQENPDQAKIRAAQKEMRELRDQIEDKRTTFLLEAMKVLTPDLRSKLTARFPRWGGCSGDARPGKGMRGDRW